MQHLDENNAKIDVSETEITSSFTDEQRYLIQQSRSAYFTIENQVDPIIEREGAAEDGESDIVSESDEDHPDS